MNKEEVMVRLEKTRVTLNSVRKLLDSAIDQVTAAQEHEVTAIELKQHKDTLFSAYARYRVLQTEYETMLNLTGRLLNQHQSAKNAFEQGWAARLTDIIAQLDTPEYEQIRDLLAEMANENEIPF